MKFVLIKKSGKVILNNILIKETPSAEDLVNEVNHRREIISHRRGDNIIINDNKLPLTINDIYKCFLVMKIGETK